MSYLELIEHEPKSFRKSDISEDVAKFLVNRYNKEIDVEPPSFINDHNWRLTSRGYVGVIPLPEARFLSVSPKVSFKNIFRMLEIAYRTEFEIPDIIKSDSVEEFYESLAKILAGRVLDRAKRGLYRAYEPHSRRLPYVRGRIDVMKAIDEPWIVDPHCRYKYHTPDVEDNQIPAYTLGRIANRILHSEEALARVRRAYHALEHSVSQIFFTPNDCCGRRYNRLNEDYRPIHALCRFFLDNTGPIHEHGDRKMVPFLINMWQLFELFIFEWLRNELPEELIPESQYPINISAKYGLRSQADIVLKNADSGKSLMVLDTKYKIDERPSEQDIYQVVTYALAIGASVAALVYPSEAGSGIDDKIDGIRLLTLSFPLNQLDENPISVGSSFLDKISEAAFAQ